MTLRETIEELIAAWRTGDALRAAAFFALDATYHEAGREPIAGREALAAYFTRFFRDGPPWRIEVDEILVDGERAAVSYRFEIRAAQGWQTRAGCALVRREAGAIAQWREYQG